MDKRNIDIHSVGGLIFNHNHEILIQYHNKYNFWTIPMGKVDNNMGIIETLRKELKEEVNIEVGQYEEIASRVYKYDNINSTNWRFKDGGETFVVLFHLFKIHNWNGDLKNNEPKKHSVLKFMKQDEVKKLSPISDALRLYLEFV